MNKIILALGLISFAAQADSIPFLNQLMGQRSLGGSHVNSRVHCVSLAGQWKGKCSAGKSDEEQTFEIVQTGCDYIGTKDGQLPIGGIAHLGFSLPQTDQAPLITADLTAALSWSGDGSALVVDLLGVAKEMGTQKPHDSAEGQGSLRLVGNKLQISYSQIGKPEVQVCEFERQ